MRKSPHMAVLVTGAGRGIGFAIARRFGAAGFHVCLNDKSEAAARAAAAHLLKENMRATALPGDVSDEAHCIAMVGRILDDGHVLGALVNNAATGRPGNIRQQTDDYWRRVLSVNLIAPFLLVKAAVDALEDSKGAVVNIASTAAYGMQGQCSYDASKGGLISLTRSLAMELGGKGVRVNSVCPGYVDTDMLNQSNGLRDAAEKAVRHCPIGRLARPEEVAEAVFWLASEEAGYVTGHALFVDGGLIRPS